MTAVEQVYRDLNPKLLRIARRASDSDADAEDAVAAAWLAYVRYPDLARLPEDQRAAYMATVTRHEAYGLRKRRKRAGEPVRDEEDLRIFDDVDGVPPPDRIAEQHERLREGVAIMRALKPNEQRALALQAAGYSYDEIEAQTGWSYTKVNRCIAEGRARFRKREELAGRVGPRRAGLIP